MNTATKIEGADVPEKKTRRTKAQMNEARAEKLAEDMENDKEANPAKEFDQDYQMGELGESHQIVKENLPDEAISKMNERALAIWNGQSPNLSMIERVGRIRAAIKDRGWIEHIESLELPTKENFKRYL
jgi:hypothetical protein